MPYARKTLTQLRDDILADINSAQITDAAGNIVVGLLQKAILRVMAYAQAGVGYEHYGELDWIALQAVPWTAGESSSKAGRRSRASSARPRRRPSVR